MQNSILPYSTIISYRMDGKIQTKQYRKEINMAKYPTNHFNSLHGAQGQRYKLTIWYDYLNKNYAKKGS